MNSFSTSFRRRFIAPLAVVAVVGVAGITSCSGQIDVAESASGTGAGGSTSSGPTSMSATSSGTGAGGSTSSGPTSMSSTSSGTGAGGSTGPLNCLPEEGAIVVGSSSALATVAVLSKGVWTEDAGVVPYATHTAAYVDVYHQLAVFWTEDAPGGDKAHFTRTKDGGAFETHNVNGWHPSSKAPLVRANDNILVGIYQDTSLAYYDSDAMDWSAWQSTPFFASSAATLATSGNVILVGRGDQLEVCDITLDSNATWGPTKCHPELPIGAAGEIPLPGPQIVALPSGDAVAVYFTSRTKLTAAVLHAGQWSAPVTTTLLEPSTSVAVAPTPAGDVIAGFISYPEGATGHGPASGTSFFALRFSPATGWASPITIDTNVSADAAPAAATGICGDDALLAYSAQAINGDGEIRIAHVHGNAAKTTTVATLVESTPIELSLATRHGN